MQDEHYQICPPTTSTPGVDQESEDSVSIVGYPPNDFLKFRAYSILVESSNEETTHRSPTACYFLVLGCGWAAFNILT
jgi:hypothetical protein